MVFSFGLVFLMATPARSAAAAEVYTPASSFVKPLSA
jgi:hypothetical protein